MLYQISRNGQTFGPYALEDLRRYIASGNVLPTDLAKSEDMPEWIPVSQVLDIAPGGMLPPQSYATPSAYTATGARFPDPPNLHWALVLLIGLFTCGLFIMVWDIIQCVWMRRVTPASKALFFYIAAVVIDLTLVPLRLALMFRSGMHDSYTALGVITSLAVFALIVLSRFDMRSYMEQHFNGPEPVGLTLSGVMTFFFGGLYFQYHFSRINELKQSARSRGLAI